MTDGFIFYASFYEAITELEDHDQLAVYRAICEYALNGKESDLKGVPLAIFKLVKPQIDANLRRRNNGSKGGRPKAKENLDETKTKPKHNLEQTEAEAKVKEKVKVKDKYKEKDKEKEKKPSVFTPPTVIEVASYVREKGYHIDPQRFVDFYTSNGWMVGKNKMKDWKACVRNWERSEKESPPKPTKFSNFTSDRRTDYDRVELELIKRGMD